MTFSLLTTPGGISGLKVARTWMTIDPLSDSCNVYNTTYILEAIRPSLLGWRPSLVSQSLGRPIRHCGTHPTVSLTHCSHLQPLNQHSCSTNYAYYLYIYIIYIAPASAALTSSSSQKSPWPSPAVGALKTCPKDKH